MPTAALITLGCKVNQYDTQAMQEVMLRNGYTVVGENEPRGRLHHQHLHRDQRRRPKSPSSHPASDSEKSRHPSPRHGLLTPKVHREAIEADIGCLARLRKSRKKKKKANLQKYLDLVLRIVERKGLLDRCYRLNLSITMPVREHANFSMSVSEGGQTHARAH